VIFETSPSLHNGFYHLCVWLLCIAHISIGMASWLTTWLASTCCCGRLAMSGDDEHEDEQNCDRAHSFAGDHEQCAAAAASMLSVVVLSSSEMAGDSVAWRWTYRHLMEQTSQHDADRTEVIFVCAASTVAPSFTPDEWIAEVLRKMPSCRLQPRLVTYAPTAGGGAIEGFRAGAAHAKGGCILLMQSDILLPTG
jgi:hypothetical protein